MSEATGPLAGMRVVELAVWVAGPACGGVLADWGADVIKLEPLDGGDPARSYARLFGDELPISPPFEMDNRSKRSVAVDLRSPDGLQIALELIDQADVFVTNIRAPALARLGLDYETLHARCPRLVYAFISGYGLEGPDADRAAYDVGAFWARSGIAAMLTTPGGDPPFQRGGMGDHTVGVSTAGAVCAALLARDRTGAGQMVTNSLLRQGVYTVGFDLSFAIMAGIQIGIGRRNTMGNPTMNNYTAGDGRKFWVIGQEADRHWPPMCRAVGRSEWLTDDRFATRAGRAMNAAELIGLLDELFATKTFDEWAAAFDTEPEFFWAPINTVDELMADEQFHASGALIDVPDDAGGTVMVASPADFSATPWQARSMAPRLGANTREVLAELGRSSDQIEALLAARRVAEPVLE